MPLLLDPGPCRLFTDEDFPRPVFLSIFGGLAWREAAELDALGIDLDIHRGALAQSGGSTLDAEGANELAAIAGASDPAGGGVDPAIGGVVAGLDVLDLDVAALSNDMGRELGIAEPGEWTIPADGGSEKPDGPLDRQDASHGPEVQGVEAQPQAPQAPVTGAPSGPEPTPGPEPGEAGTDQQREG